MFSTFDTLTDIMSVPGMKKWFHSLFLEGQLDCFPEDSWDQPLRLAAFRGQAPWGGNLQGLTEQIVDMANLVLDLQSGKRQCLHYQHSDAGYRQTCPDMRCSKPCQLDT